MHMTLEADYAVRIVERLAEKGERMDAHSLSEDTKVPLRFALKILRKLVAEQLVKSFKGAKGGYTLAREPGDITLRQVIEAVEGPYAVSYTHLDVYKRQPIMYMPIPCGKGISGDTLTMGSLRGPQECPHWMCCKKAV